MQTAEQQANEIIDKFEFCLTTRKGTLIMSEDQARQCAIIHVTGIIDVAGTAEWNDVLKVLQNMQK